MGVDLLVLHGSRFYGWQKQAERRRYCASGAGKRSLSPLRVRRCTPLPPGAPTPACMPPRKRVHFNTAAERSEQAWIRGVNAHLPEGVAVWRAQRVDARFHARFYAFGRRYR